MNHAITGLTLFPEGSFLPILCARSYATSGISHPDSSIIDFTEFLTSSAGSFFCDGMPVILTHNLLPYFSFSSKPMNGNQQSLSLLKQNLQHTKTFRPGKNNNKQQLMGTQKTEPF